MNVIGYQRAQLLWPSYSEQEGLILEWQFFRKEERSRGSEFFERMSVFGVVDSSEGGVSSETTG